MKLFQLLLLSSSLLPKFTAAAEIKHIWLSYKTNEPSKIVVNWTSEEPGDSVVRFGQAKDCASIVRIDEHTTPHHVEISLQHCDSNY